MTKEVKVRSFVDNQQLKTITLTSSALRGLVTTTLETDGDK